MMGDFDFFVRVLKLRPTPAQRKACHYLERRGKRFCIDFGTDNAIDLARADWRQRRRRKR